MGKGKTIAIVTLAILLSLSIVFNLLTLFALSVNDSDWAYSQSIVVTEWCEYSNNIIGYSNDLLSDLKYYAPNVYDDLEGLDTNDCWNAEE